MVFMLIESDLKPWKFTENKEQIWASILKENINAERNVIQ
jgi:hypothetical protein